MLVYVCSRQQQQQRCQQQQVWQTKSVAIVGSWFVWLAVDLNKVKRRLFSF